MSTRTASPRLVFLDLTKGILVILMVVYHSLNYTNQYYLGFRCFPFLPLSFILITGFLLSTVYLPRYRAGDTTLATRLGLRAAKFILLFTLLNIVAQFVRSPAYGHSIGVTAFFQNWILIYIIGSGRTAVFEVLLPIAYLLCLAPLLLALSHRFPRLLLLTTGLLVATCVTIDFQGVTISNLNLLCSGFVGMTVGRFMPDASKLGRFFWISLVLYVLFLPLSVTRGYVYVVQLCGACIALAVIAGAMLKWQTPSWGQTLVVRIGQYSLLSYISQIAILQVLSRFVGRPYPWSPQGIGLFVTTFALMSAIVLVTDAMRRRSIGADRIYKVVFA